jgi:hypothetical protein
VYTVDRTVPRLFLENDRTLKRPELFTRTFSAIVDDLCADEDNPESRTPYQVARDKRLTEAQAVRDQNRNAKEARKAHLRNYRISKSMKRAWAKPSGLGWTPSHTGLRASSGARAAFTRKGLVRLAGLEPATSWFVAAFGCCGRFAAKH